MSTFKEYLTDTVNYETIVGYITEEAELETLGEELVEIETELNELFGLGKLADKLKNRASDKAKGERKEISDETKKHFEEQKKKREKVASKEEKRKAFADKIANVSSKADEKVGKAVTAAGKARDAVVGAGKKVVDAVEKKVAEHKEASEKKANEKKVEAQGKAYEKERAAAESKKAYDEKKAAVKDSWLKISSSAKALFKKTFKDVKDVTPDQKKVLADLEGIYEKLAANKAVTGLEAIKVIAAVLAGAGETGTVPSYKAYSNQLNRLRTLPGMNGFKFAVKANV